MMSAGEMLAHIAVYPMWQIQVHTEKIDHLDFAFFTARTQKFHEDQAALKTKSEIVRALKENGEQFRRVPRGARRSHALVDGQLPAAGAALQQDAVRDVARRQGARDASPRPADADAADDRQVPHLTRARQQMQAQAAAR
jgi:hypothetical protein